MARFNPTRFRGSFVALITPFRKGRIDGRAFQDLVEWQIAQGTSGLVPCGTTGESPTLTHDEHKRVVELCIEAANGRVPVMAGTGSNNTAEAIELTDHARRAGADAALVVAPYYNKPNQAGLYAHYSALAQRRLPIFVYNIPGRCIVDVSVDTMAALAKLPMIVGCKDATGDLTRPAKTRATCGPDFIQLCGDDGTAIGFNASGGVGCISVTANIAPALVAEFQAASLAGDLVRAQTLNDRLMPLHQSLFIETSPSPVKYAASLLGIAEADVRLPLVPVGKGTREAVKAALKVAGVRSSRGRTRK
jgi:4-hydroxy-tetrahydrodipicolinate synthase